MRQWSQSEVDFLTENYGKILLKEIAAKLGRTLRGVENKVSVLKLEPLVARWSDEDTKFLMDNYLKYTARELSTMLNNRSSPHAIYIKAGQLGLRKEKREKEYGNFDLD